MHITSLRYFQIVVEAGTVRGAAERLNISASAISRQIQNLEHAFGTQLFERHQSGLRLTEEGQALEIHIRRITREFDLAQVEIKNIQQLVEGRVSFHTIEGVVRNWIFPAIAEFRQTYPGVSFDGQVVGSDAVVEAVLREQVDFGISIDPEPTPEIEILAEIDTRFVVVIASDHPLAGASVLSPTDLQEFDLAMLDNSFFTRQWLVQLGRARGNRFRVGLELNQIDALVDYVATARGVTILPDYAVSPATRALGLQVIRMVDTVPTEAKTVLYVNKRRRVTSAADEFLKVLRNHAPDGSALS